MAAASSAACGLDTSVVLRLLTGQPEAQARAALVAVRKARQAGQAVWVCDLVVAEACFALHAHYRVPKRQALAALGELLRSGDVAPLPGGSAAGAIAACLTSAQKPGFVDRMIHAQYRQASARLLTFEKAGAKLPCARLLGSRGE